MSSIKKLLLVLFLLQLQACFEYNPNQIILDNDQKDLTEKNILKIVSVPAPEIIKFILMGDSQRFYDESSDFVKSVNELKNISFVVHAGDISDFGLSQEFKWIHEIMSKVTFPYVTVVGNHDLLANGTKVYQSMYGSFNYSFEYGNYKFIMLNTNSREYGFSGSIPDLMWLRQQLENKQNKEAIIISHIPPFDEDFDNNLEHEYARILAEDPQVKLSLHGHRHAFMDEEYYQDGVRYFVTTSMEKRGYAIISLAPEGPQIEIRSY